ncbi:DNA-processing protein DprA [Variovorax sp. VNK109]|uniref:DNA-processing protein DprA n=1 Tax=Variovorax sp. VNK109 TaxID=3400919 RepID=UPI003BFE5F7E
MQRDELTAWLRLLLCPGVGNTTARRLLAAFGLPQSIFEQDTAALGTLASAAQVTSLQTRPPDLEMQVEATWRWLQEAPIEGTQRWLCTLGDAMYPASLLVTEDPPLVLFMLGQPALLPSLGRSVAIVGSRNPTPQGTANAKQFARAFSDAGLAVISGMALGVDAAAHEGALEGPGADGLATVAVVGTGLDRVYPARHRDLAHRIAQRGLIMSEFPLGTPPVQANFPRRNRIISGLSAGTLVVEAALQSGSLITARYAGEQGKEVFAIPGSIHSPQSRGCHSLIRQGAKLVESAQDVLEELRLPETLAPNSPGLFRSDGAGEPASEDDSGLLIHMGHDPVSLDALCARTGLPTATLQARLLELELDGHVGRLPGGLFQRMASA